MNVHKLIGSLGGKKFVAFLITVVTLAMKNFLGLDEDTATKIAAVAASLILGQGFSDGMTGGGSPPRAWGTFNLPAGGRVSDRFTPTCVGNI